MLSWPDITGMSPFVYIDIDLTDLVHVNVIMDASRPQRASNCTISEVLFASAEGGGLC